jgi:hypothetical protein
MTHGSRTLIGPRHRRTVFIVALVVVGVCLVGLTVAVSIYVPLGENGDGGLGEQLIEAFR